MSVASDIDVATDIDLEALFNENVPCDYNQLTGCTNEPSWKATTIPCRHTYNVCNQHRGEMLAALAGNRKWICGATKQRITGVEWAPL